MDEAAPTLTTDIPEVSEADWLAVVDAALKGKPFDRLRTTTPDGIVLEPLYTAASVAVAADEHGLPGAAPFIRGPGVRPAWDIRTEHAHPDPVATNDAVLRDLERGATSILLRADDRLRSGGGEALDSARARGGLPLDVIDHLDGALDGVLLDLAPVAYDAGWSGPGVGLAHLALLHRRGVPAGEALGALRIDPLAARARGGDCPVRADDELRAVCRQVVPFVADTHPAVTSLGLDTNVYHEAGATDGQELALLVASGAELFRAAEHADLALETVVDQLEVSIAVDADVFGSIAKLRAARWLWSRLAEACGLDEAHRALRLHARSGMRMFTAYDPWVNLLRGTAAAFAGSIGGADSVTVLSYDHAIGLPERFGRRLARNTQIVLAEESHLGLVADAAGGSWYVESRTKALAESAWAVFQRLESAGGLLTALRDGTLARLLHEAAEARRAEIRTRRRPITGVSEFPLLDDDAVPVEHPDLEELRARLVPLADRPVTAVDSAGGAGAVQAAVARLADGSVVPSAGLVVSSPEPAEPLAAVRDAEPFEMLRAAADEHRRRHGERPTVFLANLGPLAEHNARTAFTTNLLATGGIVTTGPDGPVSPDELLAAYTAAGTDVVCLCGSDDRYAAEAADVVAALRGVGVRTVLLAGRSDVEGVDRTFAVGVDAVELLTELHEILGVAE